MIELAPNHKSGLPVANPILLAAGVVGCAEHAPQVLRESGCGAIVVGPFTHGPRRGTSPPRLVEFSGGFLLDSGLQNRGARVSTKRFGPIWRRLGVPVIAQIADNSLNHALRTADHLARSDAVAGYELLISDRATPDETYAFVESLSLNGDLPVWVKLPQANAVQLASPCAQAGAAALVLSQAPRGAYSYDGIDGIPKEAEHDEIEAPSTVVVSGGLHGPAILPLVLENVRAVTEMDLGVPLIACGGIHGWDDVVMALLMGAAAIQVDGVAWVEPGLPRGLVRAWETATTATPD